MLTITGYDYVQEGEKPVDVARRIGDQEMVILFGPEEVDDGYVSQSNSEMTSQESLEMTSQEVALKQEMATKDTITLHGGATSTRLQMTSQESLEMTSQEVALKPEMATKDTITLHGGATSTRLQRSLSTVASFLKLFRPKDIKLVRLDQYSLCNVTVDGWYISDACCQEWKT